MQVVVAFGCLLNRLLLICCLVAALLYHAMNASRLTRVATSLSLRTAPSLRGLSTIEGSRRLSVAPAVPPPSTTQNFPAALKRLARDGSDALRPKLVLSPYPEDPTAIMYRNERPVPLLSSEEKAAKEGVVGAVSAVEDVAASSSGDFNASEAPAEKPEEQAGEYDAAALSSYDARRCWHKPKVSRRKAHVLRKHAIRTGTYGTYDPETGTGWDAAWDADLFQRGPVGGGGRIQSASADGDATTEQQATQGGGALGRYRVTVPKRTKRHRTREQRAQLIDRNMADMDARIDEYYAAKHAAKPPNTFENLHKRLMRIKK
jgi:Mitochondrial ribosomal protein mL59